MRIPPSRLTWLLVLNLLAFAAGVLAGALIVGRYSSAQRESTHAKGRIALDLYFDLNSPITYLYTPIDFGNNFDKAICTSGVCEVVVQPKTRSWHALVAMLQDDSFTALGRSDSDPSRFLRRDIESTNVVSILRQQSENTCVDVRCMSGGYGMIVVDDVEVAKFKGLDLFSFLMILRQ